jgi:hypothetical protein
VPVPGARVQRPGACVQGSGVPAHAYAAAMQFNGDVVQTADEQMQENEWLVQAAGSIVHAVGPAMKARDAVVQTIGVAVRGPGAFVPATEAALQICGVQVRVKGAGVQGAELVPGACGPAVRAAGPACWASGPVVILCATHVILSAAKDPYRGRSDPSRAQDDDTPAQDDDTPAQDDDTRNRDDNSLADPLCVSPSKLPKVNPPSMNILELENHRRNGTPRVSSVSRFQTHLSSSSGRSGNLWEPRSGQSRAIRGGAGDRVQISGRARHCHSRGRRRPVHRS